MKKLQNAFTLIELMIVVIVLGIIAGFGIPNFNKSQERVVERDGEYNLGVIASAMEMYKVRNAGYPDPPAALNLDDINTVLYLGVIAQNVTYACADDDDDTTFSCTAAEGSWTLRVTDIDDGIPCCSTANCPSSPSNDC